MKPTRLGFKTGEASEFDISGAPNSEDEGLTEWERDVRTAVRAVEMQNMTYREAATLTDHNKTWVGDRYREWRDDGEHREFISVQPPTDARTADD